MPSSLRSLVDFSEVQVRADVELPLIASETSAGQILVLQGKPIDEPVAQRGPFVMNTQVRLRAGAALIPRWRVATPVPVHPYDRYSVASTALRKHLVN